LSGFNMKIANIILRKYFNVLALKITVSHSNGCTSNTPSLPQPNASSVQNCTPISAKFRYISIVSLQNADTTTVKTTHLIKHCSKYSLILLVVKTVRISVEGHELFCFLQSLSVFFSGTCRGGDILLFKGSK